MKNLFKINDKVICINDKLNYTESDKFKIKLGEVYSITGIQYCNNTGMQFIQLNNEKAPLNVEDNLPYTHFECKYCFQHHKLLSMNLFASDLFLLVSEKLLRHLEETEQYELAKEIWYHLNIKNI